MELGVDSVEAAGMVEALEEQLGASVETTVLWEQPTIVAMTAYALKGDRERYLAHGMDEYISKPIAVKELIAALYDCQPLAH